MLKMIKSDSFIKNGETRKPIYFHKGLNVVMGNDTGANSIGKSTFLMIIDFVFGGEDYINKSVDTQEEVGTHSFEFIFEFNNESYYFSRSTEDFTKITVCDSNFSPLQDISIDDYNKFLADKYHLNLPGLTFRGAVSKFFRIYGRDTCDENHPLKSALREPDSAAIDGMIKLFNKYSIIADKKKAYEDAKDEESVFKKARKYEFILSVNNKKSFEENRKRIDELQSELIDLSNDSSDGLLEIDSLRAKEIANLRINLSHYKRQKALISSQLKSAEMDKNFSKASYQNDYEQLLEFFPEINQKRLEEIETFHRKISRILNKEFKENEENLLNLLEITNSKIQELESQVKDQKSLPNVAQAILEKYSKIQNELTNLKKANDNFIKSDELKAKKDALKSALDNLIIDVIAQFQAELNNQMHQLNDEIYNGKKTSPTLNISDANHYKFFTPKDGGTGSKYKGLVLFDLAVMELTRLPVIIHDSILLKQIEDYALEKILQLYTNTNKQVFIALDKGASYTEEAQKTLKQNTVLTLEPGGSELFGRAWNEIAPNHEESK
ncbi:hypothetical protein PEPCOX59622_01034 [Aedoeadaptatus coxii]|uniref:DUF2326 domain-containing protein n=1 Tax=Aedoeadaptatus coxii TaxID=755172 RepID=UPI00175B0C28|nr:DUF2326 domain-containing protein [Peptoniphilus coxii]CAC9932256.1 hypothetical protein PEPCOX59622_01034 [Peptoniphilus coxii]